MNNKKYINYSDEKTYIPKIIWCYWHSDDLPILIKKCLKSIIDNHPDFKIYILNDDNVPDEINKLRISKQSKQRKSDLIRLWYLKNYGGVWIDSTSLLSAPITLYHDYEVNCYYLNDKNFIDSWYIAAKKNSNIINKWYNELLFIDSLKSMKKYINLVNKEDKEIANIIYPSYLWIHIAIRRILHKNPNLRNQIKLMDSTSKGSPYELQHTANWDHKVMKELYEKNKYKYIKLTSQNRYLLGEEIFINKYDYKIINNYNFKNHNLNYQKLLSDYEIWYFNIALAIIIFFILRYYFVFYY